MNVVALIPVRNEELYLPRGLAHLVAEGFKIAVLDNGSTDRSMEICESFAPHVIRIDHLPFNGLSSTHLLLGGLRRMQEAIAADWFVLMNADEACDSDRGGETMRDAIRRIDAEGGTVINFDEFVFLPESDAATYEGRPYDAEMRYYYHYAPEPLRLMRAWKNIPGLSNAEDAGHRLRGPGIRLHPSNLVLRHYVTLSLDHFRRKYGGRRFPADELAKGWHINRVNIDMARVRFPPLAALKHRAGDHQTSLDRSEPWKRHFWESDGAALAKEIA